MRDLFWLCSRSAENDKKRRAQQDSNLQQSIEKNNSDGGQIILSVIYVLPLFPQSERPFFWAAIIS